MAAEQTALPDIGALPAFLRARFARRLAGVRKKGGASPQVLDSIRKDVEAALAVQARRLANWPAWQWPELPVVAELDRLQAAIRDHQLVVVAGETGSGKTTQLPKICLSLGFGKEGLIGHTQPRRLAASSVANRIAEELGSALGEQVGYKVRFDDRSADHNLICLMTDGMLLAEIQQDRLLSRYQVLIIDEAHERSLNIDFLLGFIRQLLPKRPDLKVIITSATIDIDRFAEFYREAGISVAAVTVPGRSFPVEIVYRPLAEGEEDLPRQLLAVVEEIEAQERASGHPRLDVLVFLSGERDIREAHLFLKKAELRATEILPLYARLSPKEQMKVFQAHTGRRIVLATNVAETSLTVPGIGYVIDAGTARISRYSVASKVQRLPIEAISQASANQRAGRAGRIMPGVCFRLYEETDFANRAAFTEPEIQRTNLAQVILSMTAARLGDIEQFPFLDAPEGRLIRDGYRLLHELSAMSDRGQLTPLGRELARLPLDPRHARVLFAAKDKGVLKEALVIVAALAAQDPCERPPDKQQQADQAHQPFVDKRSDFLFFWKLWQWAEAQRTELSRSAFERLLKKTFLSPRRMQEWRETHRQLLQLVQAEGWRLNQTQADISNAGYASLHQALLSGFATQVMRRTDEGEWQSCRNRKPSIWPGSALRNSKKPWLMAAEQVETSRLYARLVAEIEPEWVVEAVPYLLKHDYSEPHWSKRHEAAMAKQSINLFGLLLASGKRVNYEAFDPPLARELMIREGLVEGELQKFLPFVDANQALVKKLTDIEHRMRRHDFLVDEEARVGFYQALLPAEITNLTRLRHWYKQVDEATRKSLLMTEDFLLARSAPETAAQQFPTELQVDDIRLALEYRFDPAGQRDGVTLLLPQALLGIFPRWQSDWLVPGLLAEKIETLLRALPKNLRRQVVPVPDFVRALLEALSPTEPLLPAMTRELYRMTGLRVEQEDWPNERLPAYLVMNIRLLDDKGKTLAESRDWSAFDAFEHASLAPAAKEEMPVSTGDWVFGDIAVEQENKLAGAQIIRYPALVDDGKQVALRLLHEAVEAQQAHGFGVARLLWLARPDLIKRLKGQAASLAGFQRLQAEKSDFARGALDASLLLLLREHLGLRESAPRCQADWQQLQKVRLGAALPKVEQGLQHFSALFDHYRRLRVQLAKGFPLSHAFVHADIVTQLDDLFTLAALRDYPFDWWQQLPRYLAAIDKRLANLNKEDRALVAELGECREQYLKRAQGKAYWQQPESLRHYRLLLEELRVSLFAQQLGTRFPVSFKRLSKQWLDC